MNRMVTMTDMGFVSVFCSWLWFFWNLYFVFVSVEEGILMKLNFDFKKFLCCVLLSFVMAFGNVSALFSRSVFSDLNKQNQVYAGCNDVYGTVYHSNWVYISSNLDLELSVIYTYKVCTDDWSVSICSIDNVESKLDGDTSSCKWIQSHYTVDFNNDRSIAYIKVYGCLSYGLLHCDYMIVDCIIRV